MLVSLTNAAASDLLSTIANINDTRKNAHDEDADGTNYDADIGPKIKHERGQSRFYVIMLVLFKQSSIDSV